jgi:GNAT superfamily N-acetyltransferase
VSTPATIQALDTHWTSYFGCRLEDLRQPHTLVVPHVALADYAGAFLFRHGPACIVSVPPALTETVSSALRDQPPASVFDPTFLARLFGDGVERVIGPAWLGYADATDLQPIAAPDVRILQPDDAAALDRLAKACGVADWEECGRSGWTSPVYGRFFGGEIAAVGGYDVWGEKLAHVGIVTHPEQRRRGHGRAVVSAVAGHALRSGLIAQYRALKSNTPSLAVARVLGFQKYAVTIAVRLGGKGLQDVESLR